ncbi:ribonuclease H2, subunit C [Russula emetica]|nr:ribonuclease H2, subunit C [Russula emetica]
MAASITIAHGHGRANLPVRVPHLMPFHIQHTGPAPVSTYFRIRPHAEPLSQLSSTPDPSLPSGNSQTELTTATVNTKVVLFEEKANPSAAADADRVVAGPAITATAEVDVVVANVKAPAPASPVQQSGPIKRLSESAKRFISSFRGRTVHGVEVTLPKGYVGIVLRGDTNDRTHPHPSTGSRSKRRPVRNSRRRPTEEEELDEMSLEDEEKPPVRALKPTARFDSFVLWHPDIPVDEGKDEYLRSLSEWTNIASEIHQSEVLPT